MKFILDFLFRDWARKLLALIFALILYWNFNERQQKERTVTNVPVALELAADLVSMSDRELNAVVKVRGSERELRQLNTKQLTGRVKVNAGYISPEGVAKIPLSVENISSPGRISIIGVEPELLVIPIQRRISRQLKVEPQFSGTLPKGYALNDVRCIPAVVNVTGPERTVKAMDAVHTKSVPLEGSIVNFTYEADLVMPPLVTTAPESIGVQVDVSRSLERRSFNNLPILISKANDSLLELIPETGKQSLFANVVVSGSEDKIAALRPSDIVIYVNLSKITLPGAYVFPLECHVKSGDVEIRAITPSELKIKLVKLKK